MPMDRKLYPDNWEEIAYNIKAAVNWTCQNCGRKCRHLGESKSSFLTRTMMQDDGKLGRYILTVAHLNHRPSDNRPENLRALCSACHLRYDVKQMALKRYLKRERAGQKTLDLSNAA